MWTKKVELIEFTTGEVDGSKLLRFVAIVLALSIQICLYTIIMCIRISSMSINVSRKVSELF